MNDNNISSLATAISTRRCVLFAGAGLTADSGGATWENLIKFLKDQLNYSSPLTDGFRIVGDMIFKFGKEKVYSLIRERLKDVHIDNRFIELTYSNFQWYTVFTTNYDLALENSLRKNQKFRVDPVITGKEFNLTGIQSQLLCVKLMGSLDVPYDKPGSMVLTRADLNLAMEERSRIFNELQNHAANLSFLFVGYSFRDGLFFDILEKLVSNLGRIERTYYAVFREKPDVETSYLLDQYGVKIIISELDDFVKTLSYQIKLRDPQDYTLKRIPIGSDVIPLNSTQLGVFYLCNFRYFLRRWKKMYLHMHFFMGIHLASSHSKKNGIFEEKKFRIY